MYLVEVIPATKIPLTQPQIFTYYTSLKLQRGSLVLVPVNRRFVEGIVTESRELKKEKMSVRKLGYELKNINKILINGDVLSERQIELIKWMANYYHIPLGLSLKTMLPKHPKKFELAKDAIQQENTFNPPVLPNDLKNIFNLILASTHDILLYNSENTNLSHLYASLIAEVIKNKKQILILEPRIELAKNFFAEMQKYFDKNAVLLDKNLPPKKYWDIWQKIKNNSARVVVGTRSSIFAPMENLGLIILKNEHSASYKNWDQQPRYNAKDIAIKLSEFANAKIIYESATPSLETYYKTTVGNIELIEIKKQKDKIDVLPELVDMREELQSGNFSIISQKLQKEIAEALAAKGKIILFINKRGMSTAVICRDCGFIINCDTCSVPMVYHQITEKNGRLLCHYCNREKAVPLLCPKCRSHRIKYVGIGTQKVAEAVKKVFPEAKLKRIDSDSLTEKIATAKHGEDNNADILIGTQMIITDCIKNKFSLAGVINADVMLHLPDFRSGETTFQLLCQLKNMAKKTIIQTYNTDNYSIKNDYKSLFAKEIADREALSYPPFSSLIKLTYADKDNFKSKQEAKILRQKLSSLIVKAPKEIEILGPSPAYIFKVKNHYIWQMVIKLKPGNNEIKKELLSLVPDKWLIDIDPISLL